MAFYAGDLGPCRWALLIGEQNDADLQGFVRHIKGLDPERRPGVLVLDLIHGISTPTALQRRAVSEAVKSLPAKHLIAGHAVVTDSAVARHALTAINWLVGGRPFPESVFRDPAEAFDWFEELRPTFERKRVLEAIARDVPRFPGLVW